MESENSENENLKKKNKKRINKLQSSGQKSQNGSNKKNIQLNTNNKKTKK